MGHSQRSGATQPPEALYWLPLYHAACGDTVDYGVENTLDGHKRLVSFLPNAVAFPCPYHGSATGEATDTAHHPDGITYLAANKIWYRLVDDTNEMQIRDGHRNANVANEKRKS